MSDHSTDKKDQIFDLTLMSNFVHQVVNPLNAVCGTLDNIANGDVPVGSIKQRVRASRSQIEYCVELIRNLAFLGCRNSGSSTSSISSSSEALSR